MNPYLLRLRTQYDELRTAIQSIQTAAATAAPTTEGGPVGRDLTADELRSVETMGEQAAALVPQIQSLTDAEIRSREVAAMAASIADDGNQQGDETRGEGAGQGEEQNRGGARPTGNASTQDRDPGHYVRAGQHSFFGDMYRARQHDDEDARRRLAEHNRALTTGTHGPGLVPPHWMTEEYELLARQDRYLANAVRYIPLGDDPRPITLPKQTAGTDAVVLEQTAENDAVAATDLYDSDIDTVTPKPTAGQQIVSRQMLDMSSPAIDLLIYGDLMASYNLKIEKKVGAAVVAAAGTAVTTFATEAAFRGTLPAVPASDAVIDAAIAVRNARKLRADIIAMGVARHGAFLKLRDNTGRPLIPAESVGQMNVIGVGDVAMEGRLEGLGVIATEGINTGTYPESICVLRASDTILFEGAMQRFRFEEVVGPESIKLGVWAYSAVIVRQAGKSVKRIVVTAAV